MMKSNEFNLSVLENVTEFASPLKYASDYEVILGLIQQGFETRAENETDFHKVANPHHTESEKQKYSNIYDNENLLQSPDRVKSCSKKKNRTSLLKNCQSYEKEKNQKSDKFLSWKSRSLGAARPRRSLNPGSKIKNVSTFHSFKTLANFENVIAPETGTSSLENRALEQNPIDSDFQGIQDISEAPFVNTNIREQRLIPKETKNNEKSFETVSENPKSIDSSQIEFVASKFNDPYSPEKSQDEDFVESSQSLTSSRLRQKLHNLRRSSATKSVVIERKLNGNQENSSAMSEDEDQNFSSSFLPGFKSAINNERDSVTSPQPAKRKVSPLEWYAIVSAKQQKFDSSKEQEMDSSKRQENDSLNEQENKSERPENESLKVQEGVLSKQQKVESPKKRKINSLRQQKMDSQKKSLLESSQTKQNEVFSSSPLKGLSQEFDRCIDHCDYEQMSEDLKTEMSDVTNFTFETIELLNDYEESNELTNNIILSKIFSPSFLEIKDEPLDHSDPSDFHKQSQNDPLHIEAKLNMIKTNERTTIVNKRSVRKCPRVSNKFLMKQIEESENIAPSSSKTKKNVSKPAETTGKKSSGIEKYLIRPRRSLRKFLSESTTENETIIAAKAKPQASPLKRTSENTKKSNNIEDKKKINKIRRNSGKSKIKTPTRLNLPKLESDVDLAVEAADISRKIEEAKKNARLPEETLQLLKNLIIELRHDVLPQHNIEKNATSKHLTFEERKEFLQFSPLNKDNYTVAEDETIKANWEAFCEDHDWESTNYEPFLNFKHGDELIMCLKERRKFVQYLADGLPNRSLYSVYSRFKRIFEKPSSAGCRYTAEEDTKILAYMLHIPAENSDKKCFELSKVLGRKRESICTRYKKLKEKCFPTKKKDVLTKVEWNLSLVEEYITTLLDVTLSEDLMDLKNAFIPKVVWLKMEQKMKIRWQSLSRFWEQQLHLQLFATQPIYLIEIKIKLIEHIYSSKIAHPMDIKWHHVLTYFDGLTTYFLRKTFNHLTDQISKKLRTRNFKRIMDWLRTIKIKELAVLPKDKCLPRILYNNKKAKFLEEDIEKIQSYSENVEAD